MNALAEYAVRSFLDALLQLMRVTAYHTLYLDMIIDAGMLIICMSSFFLHAFTVYVCILRGIWSDHK